MVVEDFGTRPAGAGIAHLPEVVLVEPGEALGIDADLVLPDTLGLVIADMDGDPEFLPGQTEHLGEKVPGEVNGIALEVVPKLKLPSISKKVWCRAV